MKSSRITIVAVALLIIGSSSMARTTSARGSVPVDTISNAGADTHIFNIEVAPVTEQTVTVSPTAETDAIPSNGDAADDPAIWIHPTDPSLSIVIGTDKTSDGGLAVYNLDGSEIQFIPIGRINNIGVRYGFTLGDNKVSMVAGSNRSNDSIIVYAVDPATRLLSDVAARTNSAGIVVYGSCMY